MSIVRLLIVGTLSLALSACSVFQTHSEVDALNEAQAVGNPFTQRLAAEYRDFSNIELKEMFDYPDALHFARKGLAAAAGEEVLPEPIADWNLKIEHMEELGAARSRILVAFDLGARDVAPDEAAIAQARFDCWIEQQEENWQDNDIASCRQDFYAAIEDLESRLQKPAPVVEAPQADDIFEPVTAVAVDDAPPLNPEDAMYLVFFDFDSSKIGPGGASVIDAIVNEVSNRDLQNITILGHADSSGPKDYNIKLGKRRANAVKDALTAKGIDASIITTDTRGETELLVPTPDGVREPANRRAEVTFR